MLDIKADYYLTLDEIYHYKYMIENGYPHKIVEMAMQKWIVFPLINKIWLGVAWPTVTGSLDGCQMENSIIFQHDAKLEKCLMQLIKSSTILRLVFPRYGR